MMRSGLQQPKVGIVFLGRKRAGFDMEWGKTMMERVRSSLGSFDWMEPSVNVTDDATIIEAVNQCKAQDVDALVTLQTTMSDARLARTLCQVWPDPVVLWATPENPDGTMISSCSLVGIHNWASNLFHYGREFEIVNGAPEEAQTQVDLDRAVRLLTAKRRLATSRLGIIGGQAPGFFAMAPDANALYAHLGVQVQRYSLIQFLEMVHSVGEEAIAEDVKRVEAIGMPYRDAEPGDLATQSRYYLAFESLYNDERLDALALQCWPELPNAVGQWPYLSMARISDTGVGIAMEGDGDGALTATIGGMLGMGACYLTDWLEHDEKRITFWHPGNIPFSLSPKIGTEGGPVLARHFNNKKPLVVESVVRTGEPVTIARLWNVRSGYRLTAFEGTTVAPNRGFMGAHAVVELSNHVPGKIFDELCHRGMPHHVGVFFGSHEKTLRSWARLSGVEFVG